MEGDSGNLQVCHRKRLKFLCLIFGSIAACVPHRSHLTMKSTSAVNPSIRALENESSDRCQRLFASCPASDCIHASALAALKQLANADYDLGLVPQSIYEYWVVATRPVTMNGLGRERRPMTLFPRNWRNLVNGKCILLGIRNAATFRSFDAFARD